MKKRGGSAFKGSEQHKQSLDLVSNKISGGLRVYVRKLQKRERPGEKQRKKGLKIGA